MSILKIDGFGGIAPLIDPKKLPDSGAQHAQNCVFDGTDLRPLRTAVPLQWGGPAPSLSARIHMWKTRWLSWASEVDVVNSPVPNDTWERIYWTRGVNQLPRFAINTQLQSAVDMTNLGMDLGIRGPVTAPTVVPSEIEEPSITAETLAQTSPVRVSTAADHPFEDGQRVIVSLAKREGAGATVPATPPDRTGMVELNGKSFVTKLVRTDAGVSDLRAFDLIGSDGANYSEYEPDNWIATITRVFGDDDMVSRSYVATYVSPYGEESQPSPPSDVIDVLKESTVTVQIQLGPEQISAGYKVRLYRSVTGTNGTEFFFVKEAAAIVNLTMVDDIDAAALGEILPSDTWAPPPVGLTGLVAMPGGFFAGFVGNTVYFSEPYMPHAWPFQYTRTTQDDVVGLAVYGQTLVVMTKGKPYVGGSSDPASVSLEQVDLYAPCLSKSCITSTGSGVIYPTFDGLAHISTGTPRILTQNYYSKADWAALWSSGARAAIWHDGRYIAAIGSNCWLFQPVGERINISFTALSVRTFGINTNQAAANPSTPRDTLHFTPLSPAQLHAFNLGTPMSATWASRIFALPRPESMACGQVYADAYPVELMIHAARVVASGQPPSMRYPNSDPSAQTVLVLGPEPFRLAGGFMAREWRIDVESAASVQSVVLATSMDELRSI